jgi:protoporphyrin/coproporphyrin ferrochelatase
VNDHDGPPQLLPGDQSTTDTLSPYDAVLLVSFGGPERPEEVMPFLESVTSGRGIPRERLAQVGQHYFLFGGRSPINDQCRMLLAALGGEFSARDIDIALYWGNRNSDPFLAAELRRIAADGHQRVLALMTSAYPSYSSCRQYRENLYDAARGTGLQIDRVRHYAHHPGFVAASVAATTAALDELGPLSHEARLVFVTHSIPTPMAEASGPPPRSAAGGYVDWHHAVAAEVTRAVSGLRNADYSYDLAYCSRSGPPSQPWLEPDINDHLVTLRRNGVQAVVAVPIGFISDHMEVIYDLDTEAAQTAAELGLPFVRAATAGTDPAFVSGLVDLLVERAAVARGEAVDAPVIPGGTVGRYSCLSYCCPNSREPGRPALCQG